MSEEKRRAGDYEIIQAVQIGDCEIVVGENMADENDLPYMVAYYEYNAIMGRYFEAVGRMISEIMEIYGQRIMEQAQKPVRICPSRKYRVLTTALLQPRGVHPSAMTMICMERSL